MRIALPWAWPMTAVAPFSSIQDFKFTIQPLSTIPVDLEKYF